mmetsp:Transcript_3403/g.5249  ORF Transcript_3403/g.5249 Transcript_3403/m.5249 type:complete len:115 (+) Transcript_3403:48-392(+)
MDPEVIAEARAKLMKKQAGNSDALGGMRRKQKRVHKTPTSTDDKKLLSALKKVGCNPIPGIEEVNMFKSDGRVIHFANPKLQASLGANTYAETREPLRCQAYYAKRLRCLLSPC